MKAHIIIGANLGDEGKGTVVAKCAKNATGSKLNILTNGGAQRGHSILTEDGSFTFHHFGSGSTFGADNYFSKFYILNPMQFVQEYESLKKYVVNSKIYVHPDCMWTTPWDMMANQILEENRGEKSHGTCGMGIWETVLRYHSTVTINFEIFCLFTLDKQVEYLKSIKNYFLKRLGNIPDSWKEYWDSEDLTNHFLQDCKTMFNRVTGLKTLDSVSYDNLIFENGQGLELSDKGIDDPYTTPSKTGLDNPLELLKELSVPIETEVHYVTRSYNTRHGKGNLELETDRKNISSGISEDRTNHWNEFQKDFRFGDLDLYRLKERVDSDFSKVSDMGFTKTIEVTHCDELDREKDFKKLFPNVRFTSSALI